MPNRDRNGVPYKPRRVPPPTEEQVMGMANRMPTEILRALVLTSAYSGLRVTETCNLNVGDLDADGVLMVRKGKGRTQRQVDYCVCFEPALSAVRALGIPKGIQFPNADGGRYSKDAINKHWTRVRDELGYPKTLWFHDLRKFHATWLLARGLSDIDVAIQLRHVDGLGRPNPELVRKVYGWADIPRALQRIKDAGSDAPSQEGSHAAAVRQSSAT
jgi:integrase